MIKKRFLTFLALLCLTVSGAWAQETLTVYDGIDPAQSSSVPVCGTWADKYLKCEMVYPASDLSEMAGGTINKMMYYKNVQAAATWTGTFQVFMKEVTDASISSYYGTDGATIVYEGKLNSTQSTMEITFSTPYHYNGGNLLVGVYQTVTGKYKDVQWAGKVVQGASVHGYDSSSLSSISPTQQNFLPKATFTYKAPALCGPNLTWDLTDGVLTISGTGEMYDYDYTENQVPWFSSKESITSVIIPDGVTRIGNCAFYACTGLTSIEIPNSVTSIGNTAFAECSGLKTVTILAESLESYGSDAFDDTHADLKIYVPAGSVATYKAGWSEYADKITTPTYTVTLKEGTEDADNWTITPEEAKTTGVAQGTEITATYSGTKLVKSVKAVKKPGPAATVTTAPTATTGDISAGSETALVSGGTAEGGTMMYKVTTENTQPASTEGFSADVPTAQATAITAPGTYYVWYYVKADDSHTDSEISATGIAVTIAAKAAAEVTAEDKDKLICTDGHIHEYGKDAWCTKARVALIIYIGTEGHDTYKHGLALALTDVSQNALSWDNSGANNGGKTAAEWCSAWNTSKPVKDAEWLLPSYNQWICMLNACGTGSDRFYALWGRFTSVGGSNLQSGGYYWSSTLSYSDQVWYVTIGMSRDSWSKAFRVRACLAF